MQVKLPTGSRGFANDLVGLTAVFSAIWMIVQWQINSGRLRAASNRLRNMEEYVLNLMHWRCMGLAYARIYRSRWW
jgi:hypothetical protein